MVNIKDCRKICSNIDSVRGTLDNLYKKASEHKENLKKRELLSETVNAIEICEEILSVNQKLINIQLNILKDTL